MSLLIAGVIFWSVVHLMPAAAPLLRAKLAARLGEGPFKGLFAVDIVIALAIIIYAWRSAVPTAVFAPPTIGDSIPGAFLVMSVILFVASSVPNNLKRHIRHPQMAGVLCWSIGHLLSNGDSRSLVLFGGFGIWAILEMIFINRRDGEWQRPGSVAPVKDVIGVVVAAAVFAVLVYFHPTVIGVSAIPA